MVSFCTLVLWPCALRRAKFSIRKNVLPEVGDSTFPRNVRTWLHGVIILKIVYSMNLNVNLMNCVYNLYRCTVNLDPALHAAYSSLWT